MTTLHRIACPKCGYMSHADKRGRMMCCEGVRENDIRETVRLKGRCKARKTRTLIQGTGAEGEGAANVRPFSISAGQFELFEMEG